MQKIINVFLVLSLTALVIIGTFLLGDISDFMSAQLQVNKSLISIGSSHLLSIKSLYSMHQTGGKITAVPMPENPESLWGSTPDFNTWRPGYRFGLTEQGWKLQKGSYGDLDSPSNCMD